MIEHKIQVHNNDGINLRIVIPEHKITVGQSIYVETHDKNNFVVVSFDGGVFKRLKHILRQREIPFEKNNMLLELVINKKYFSIV